MKKTLMATFDGKVFHPEQRVDLEPNTRCCITIEVAVPTAEQPMNRAFQRLLARATDLGISDLAEQHDHYLYGTEKR